jgi:hypothetical protein
MVEGGSHYHLCGIWGGLVISKVKVEENVLATNYQSHTPPEIQAEIDLSEVDSQVLRHFIEYEVVNKEICAWIPNTGSSRTRESKYYKMRLILEHEKSHGKGVG